LSAKRYVYWWADGVYFKVRLDEERTCALVLIGATEDGTKELLAVVDRLSRKRPILA
jgi:putative transposase